MECCCRTATHMPVVIDPGSHLCKAGLASSLSPPVVFATPDPLDDVRMTFGITNGDRKSEDDHYEEVTCGARGQREFVSPRGHPIQRGVIVNWDYFEAMTSMIFEKLAVSSDQHPVLVTESFSNRNGNREAMAEILFETFRVPSLAVALQALMSMYASGSLTGVVQECGAEVCQTASVFQGHVIPGASLQLDYGSVDVVWHLSNTLVRKGSPRCLPSVAARIVEDFCFVSMDFERDMTIRDPEVFTRKYQLPDGTVFHLQEERFKSPEALFQPAFIGLAECGVHRAIQHVIGECDPRLRRDLYRNVVLAGGSSLMSQFPNRMRKEVLDFAGADDNVRIVSPPEIVGKQQLDYWKRFPHFRKFSVWIGASILASTAFFDRICVGRRDYEEYGAHIVNRK